MKEIYAFETTAKSADEDRPRVELYIADGGASPIILKKERSQKDEEQVDKALDKVEEWPKE